MSLLSFRRDLKNLDRLRQIATILVEHGFSNYLEKMKLAHHATITSKIKSKEGDHTPQRVRETLEALGPTFVKLGQILSLRPDLIPHEYCEEFRKLQDDVAPLSFPIVKGVIESELARPLHKVFRSVEHEPLAAASVSQVHRGVLLDGRKVAIKVQRPGVREIMARDIDIMLYLAERIDHHFPNVRATSIVNEFRNYTERELDFTFELRNTKKFHAYFSSQPQVVIPDAYEELSSSRVLVMDYLEGVPMSDRKRLLKEGHSARELVRIGLRAMVFQAFDLGVFHADAHPGNLIAMHVNGKEAFAFLDFGIVGFMDEELQRNFLSIFECMVRRDVHGLLSTLLKIGKRGPGFDEQRLKDRVGTILMDWYGTNLHESRMSSAIYRIIIECLACRVEFPPNAVLFAKAFVTMEGSVTWLDPDFDLQAEMKPHLQEIFKRHRGFAAERQELMRTGREMQAVLHELPEAAKVLLDKIEEGKLELHMDNTEFSRAEKDYDMETSKKSLALVCAAFFIGSAVIAGLSPELSFLSIPLYELGFILFFVTLAMFIYVSIKTHKYLQKDI